MSVSNLSIQPVITANGEVINATLTKMGAYTALIGGDFFFKKKVRSAKGLFDLGLASLYCGANGIATNNTKNSLYVYFYNSSDGNSALFGKIPSFLNAKLEMDASKITAFANGCLEEASLTSVKEGLVKDSEDFCNVEGLWSGITFFWPKGYGTGTFDSMCVSLVDLSKLTDHSANSSYCYPIYAGRYISRLNGYLDTSYISYIRNGVEGITDNEHFLLKIKDKVGLWDYNLNSGKITQSSSDYNGYMGAWGQIQYVVDGCLYGITTLETPTTTGNSSSVFKYNLSTKESSYFSCRNTKRTCLLKVGTELYIEDGYYDYSYWEKSTNEYYAPTYKRIDKTNMIKTSETLTLTVPTYLGNAWRILSYDEDGVYILQDLFRYNSFKFTDLNNIEGSITEPLWIYRGQPFTVGENIRYMCYGETYYSFYSDFKSDNTSFGYNRALLVEDVCPIIAYGKFSKQYEKPADAEFTSSYYLTSSVVEATE